MRNASIRVRARRTLIVALGILPRLADFALFIAAVFVLTLFALIVNCASGDRLLRTRRDSLDPERLREP